VAVCEPKLVQIEKVEFLPIARKAPLSLVVEGTSRIFRRQKKFHQHADLTIRADHFFEEVDDTFL
jgi:hypothetical protein